MRKLSNAELKRITVSDFKSGRKLPVVVVLDNIRSQQNIGSVFRTSDAFRIAGIHLCGISATPPHREIHRTALGATESVDWKHFRSTVDSVLTLRSEGYLIFGVEQTDQSVPLSQFRPPEGRKLALVFGNEIHGISDEVVAILNIGAEGQLRAIRVIAVRTEERPIRWQVDLAAHNRCRPAAPGRPLPQAVSQGPDEEGREHDGRHLAHAAAAAAHIGNSNANPDSNNRAGTTRRLFKTNSVSVRTSKAPTSSIHRVAGSPNPAPQP